jgi:hypothetical protein
MIVRGRPAGRPGRAAASQIMCAAALDRATTDFILCLSQISGDEMIDMDSHVHLDR